MSAQNLRSNNRGPAATAMKGVVTAVVAFLVAYVGVWQWSFCRVEVPPGYSLLLRYKGPWPFGGSGQAKAPEGTLVETDKNGHPLQVGILRVMPGPGRHFYTPLEYERELVKDQVIPPGKLAVVTSKVGTGNPLVWHHSSYRQITVPVELYRSA